MTLAIRRLFLTSLWFLLPYVVFSQCQLLDGNNVASGSPIYIGCSKRIANDTDFVITVRPASNFGAWTMNWGDGNNSAGGSLLTTGQITHTYVSVTGGGTIFADTFTFTFTSGACTITGTVISGYPVTANIEVPGGLTQLTCAPGILTFINNSNGASNLPVMPGTTFEWDWGDGSPVQIFDFTTAGDTIFHTYQKNTVNCITQVDLTADNECNLSPSTNSQSPVLIYDIDDAGINASATVLCYPDTIVYFANGSLFNCYAQGNTDQRYEYWNFGDHWNMGHDSIFDWRPSGAPLGTPAPDPIEIAFPGIGSYVVNMIDSNMCGQDPAAITINIVAPPTADLSSDDTVCQGELVTFQNLSTGGANVFLWNFGDGGGFASLGAGNKTHTYNITGSFIVTLAINISGSNCWDTTFWNIEVLPTPTADIAFNKQNGCDSLTVTFSDNSTGTPVTWAWDFDNGNLSSNQNPAPEFFAFPANYNVTLTITNVFGCDDSDSQVINIYQTPVPDFTPNSLCVNQLGQFLDLSTFASGDPIISWDWNFDDGSPNSILQNPTHIYTLAATYDVTLEVATAHCSALDTLPVVAEQLPTSSFAMDTTSGCSPLAVQFTNTSSLNADHYFWDFGDGDTSTSVSPTHVFLNNFGVDTVYNIMLVSYTTFGCSDTLILPVQVFPNPVALFTETALPINCTPAVLSFTNLSSNGASTYLWDFGNGNTSTLVNPSDTFVNSTNFLDTSVVTLTAFSANGCTDTTFKIYLVFPKPTSIPAKIDSGCVPLKVTFPAVVNAVTYQWNFGGTQGTSSLPTPTTTYQTAGDYNVRLISSSAVGCRDTSFGLVRVYPKPVSFFTTNVQSGCTPLPINLTATSPGASLFHWDFGDGFTLDTTANTASHIFTNSLATTSVYDVELVVENSFGCSDTSVNSVSVFPIVIASYENDTIGCSPFGGIFTNTSVPANSSWGWFFGDGTSSSQMNPAHTYINNGTGPDSFVVSLKVQSPEGCTDSVASMLWVYPMPNANFSVDPPTNTQTYPDTIFTFNNLDLNWEYLWDFGDGKTSVLDIPPPHKYIGWGTFTVKLVAFNEYCRDSTSDDVTILPPLPRVNFGDPAEGCEDLTVLFKNKSKYAETYRWEFVNALTSSKQSSADKDPEITFTDPGTYNVTLFVEGEGGSDDTTAFGYVTVYEEPTAEFSFAPEEVFVPTEAVVFFNNSRGDDLTYLWLFGDGTSSNAENPEHYYQEEGEYAVVLVASNALCKDSAISLTPVLAKPSGNLETPNAFTPQTDGDPGNDGAYDYSIPGYDRSSNDVFYPKVSGEIKNYEFTIYNKWGELLFRTEKRTVGWTGWYRKELCQQDVYVFKVKATKIDNSEVVIVGDLTLLR